MSPNGYGDYTNNSDNYDDIDLGEFGELGESDEIDLGVETSEQNEQLPPADIPLEEQPEAVVEQLGHMEALQPETWPALSESERIAALQEVENSVANIQGRSPVEVRVDSEAPEGVFGAYEPNSNNIAVSGWHINSDDIQEVVDTIAHEGRHAYQNYAVNNPGFHPDEAEVAGWRDNFDFYLDAETYGQEEYQNQPVEADAWQNGSRIAEMLYGPKS